MHVMVEVNGAVLRMDPDPTMPLRFLKEEALALIPSPYPDLDVWLGPGPQRKLLDDVSLATQGITDQAELLILPKVEDRPPSPQEQLAIKTVTLAVDELVKRGALCRCGERLIHNYVVATISAALQGLVSTGKLQPWQDSGCCFRYDTIRPELDTCVWVMDNEAGQKFGPGHFAYGYFFHVSDIETNVPHESKRCFSYYRLDASQWLNEVEKP